MKKRKAKKLAKRITYNLFRNDKGQIADLLIREIDGKTESMGLVYCVTKRRIYEYLRGKR